MIMVKRRKWPRTGPIFNKVFVFVFTFVFVFFFTKESKPAKDRTKREQQTNENMELISLPEKSINDEVRQDLASTLEGHLV